MAACVVVFVMAGISHYLNSYGSRKIFGLDHIETCEYNTCTLFLLKERSINMFEIIPLHFRPRGRAAGGSSDNFPFLVNFCRTDSRVLGIPKTWILQNPDDSRVLGIPKTWTPQKPVPKTRKTPSSNFPFLRVKSSSKINFKTPKKLSDR